MIMINWHPDEDRNSDSGILSVSERPIKFYNICVNKIMQVIYAQVSKCKVKIVEIMTIESFDQETNNSMLLC